MFRVFSIIVGPCQGRNDWSHETALVQFMLLTVRRYYTGDFVFEIGALFF